MTEFLKSMFSAPKPALQHKPVGKTAPVGKVQLPGGKGFKFVREDILQKGLTRGKHKKAA